MSTVDVHFLPSLTTPEALSGATVVVIDVLRATTTITAALAAGAVEVIPCFEIDEAQRIAAELPAGTSVLGGERGGKRIECFDLGNSPSEYTPDRVAGKTVVITTTNGTQALRQCRLAAEVWLGSLTNLGSVVARIAAKPTIHIVCAGTDGEVTFEDVLTAGMFVQRLQRTGSAAGGSRDEGDSARIAGLIALASGNTEQQLRQHFAASLGGRNLVELGYMADIFDAVKVDAANVAPRLDLNDWRIRVAQT